MSSHETDHLLPKGSQAPEIHGSRPQSINDLGLNSHNEEETVVQKEVIPQRKTAGQSIANGLLGALFVIIFLRLLLMPTGLSDPFDKGNPHWKPQTIDERVLKILSETPLIDGHNDLAILIRFLYNNRIYEENFTKPFEEGGMKMHVDLPRLKAGKVGGAFWSAYGPCPANGTDYSDENYIDSVAFTYNQIDVLNRLQAAYPNTFSPALNSSSALQYFKKGLLISPLGVEGLHQIGNSLTNLRSYFALGVRYSTLTHNCHNIYADAALRELPNGGGIEIAKPLHHGVSPVGESLILEMNRLGMIVDLAHVSYDTMKDVLGGNPSKWNGSLAPPIFSHSSAYAVCPHPRNVRDDILTLVQARKSLVMVNFSPDFISCETDPSNPHGLPKLNEANSTLEHVVDHIVYIGEKIGYEYVGLGSDFDGIMTTPRGLEDVGKFPELVKELLKRGVSDGDASNVVGGNLLRVWGEVDRVAGELKKKGVKPAEDVLPRLGFPELNLEREL